MSMVVVIHLTTALVALALGTTVLLRRKGTASHKAMGRVWVALIVVAAVSSFWIRDLGDGSLSAIHLLSAWTLVGAGIAVAAIRKRKVRRHRGFMIGTFVGLTVAGMLALAPGRFLGGVLLGW